jgi:hypothetical protein
MSPADTRTRKRTPPTRKKKGSVPARLTAYAPLILGILITPLTIWAASILAMSGPSGLRLLYPYVVLARAAHASQEYSSPETLSQWIMFVQFPAYGVIWMVGRRLIVGPAGAFAALMVHCAGVAAVIMNANA